MRDISRARVKAAKALKPKDDEAAARVPARRWQPTAASRPAPDQAKTAEHP